MRRVERLWLPGGREVVLGWADVGAGDEARLGPLEHEALARCRTDKRRREFVAGRLAAHRALALLEPGGGPGAPAQVVARVGGPDAGRPGFEPERGLALSISHAKGLAVAALARGAPLGVDLEAPVDVGAAFLEEAFAPGEHEAYVPVCAGRLDVTTAAWALKEAVLKVWGVGLRAPLHQVAVRPVVLEAGDMWLALRLRIRTGALAPDLGTPPTELVARLEGDDAGWVLALAG